MRFLFPADPLNPRQVDEYFKPQANALTTNEYYSLLSLERFKITGGVDRDMIDRGWMLSGEDYFKLADMVEREGGSLFTGYPQYTGTHYLPSWYPLVSEYTAETVIYKLKQLNSPEFNLVEELNKLGWNKFFLKDYVKSLKTGMGSIIDNAEDAPKVLALMEHYRGNIEGGLCVRKYEPGLHEEQRYFVVNKQAFSTTLRRPDLGLLNMVIRRIDSPFFSVDIAYNEEGTPRIVEIGDGQVSDLVGDWTPELLKLAFTAVEGD